jgi:protein O-mannosyl-transferase
MDVQRPRLNLALALALAALTIAVYAPVRGFEFVNYDDDLYVVENAHVGQGLSPHNVLWSLTAFENGNWHPLTLLSHMLDVSVFGLRPAGHHGVNLALHVVNALLLFWLLAATTMQPWPSALVGALFAVHPLNVQTVAWVSERKSVLSTMFWLLALLVYARYRTAPDAKKYSLLLLLAAFALAAKPMAVTLPLTLILLDVWPLETQPQGRKDGTRRGLARLAPFFALSLICGVLTLLAQRAASALQSVETYSWPVRVANAICAYAWYLKAMVWPVGLAAFYPHPMTTLTLAAIVPSAAVLVVISAAVTIKRPEFPAPAMGWWWYVVTLAPVAGIIQVGAQAYADRYAYVPLVGIFIAAVWSVARLTERQPVILRRAAVVAGIVWVAALSVSARGQLAYWHDSVSLFERAIEVVPDNALAHNNLGMALVERDRMAEALEHFQKAVEIAPLDTDARSNLGNALRALKRPADAVNAYETALEQAPNDASIHYNLATALVDLGRLDEASRHLRDAVRLDPAHAKARFLLGTVLYRQGRADDALGEFREIARRDPGDERAGEWVRKIEGELRR